jgi:hypothetical protein
MHLPLLQGDKRDAVLCTLSIEAFFAPPVTQESTSAIVGYVEEICREWRWQ